MTTRRVWLFDLDNTLHDAGAWVFARMNDTMRSYVVDNLGVSADEADALREKYWRRYGSTMLGLVRHHDVSPAHFLHETHRFPGLEHQVTGHRHDLAAIARLRGRRIVLTNAPRAYAMRVLGALGIVHLFDEVLSIEDMRMFGHWRPKPDTRMLRRVGMEPVWMQRSARRGAHAGPRVRRWTVHPSGVRIVRSLLSLG